MKKLRIVDTTLRDGEQTPGVVFRPSEKCIIAEKLADCGIEEIEVPSPIISSKESKVLKQLAKLSLKSSFLIWSRAKITDLKAASGTQIGRIHFSFPASPVLQEIFHLNPGKIYVLMKELVGQARKDFDFISIGLQDVGRMQNDFLLDFLKWTAECEVDRIRLADTIGIMNPMQVFQLIHIVKSQTKIPLGFHAHNDLGMATANSLMAVAAGADVLDVTVNGIGERAGNAALEEVVLGMEKSLHLNSHINLEKLYFLSQLVSKYSRIPIAQNKPITGSKIFMHESGIHTYGLLKNENSYTPFLPSLIGQKENRIVFGKHSGSHALMKYLETQKIYLSQNQLVTLLQLIKEQSAKKKKLVTEAEIKKLLTCLKKKSLPHAS